MSTRSSIARPAFVGVAVLALALAGATPAHAAGVPGDAAFLDTAAAFSVIGGATVTNTGPTIMPGSLAVSPGSAVTGAPVVGGEIHSNDAVAIQAQLDVTTAANAIMAVPSYEVGPGDLDGLTFQAGAYSSASSLLNAGTITLNGDADDVFIFTAVSSLTMGSGSTIAFEGGAQACNVFWRIGSSVTINPGAHFAGTAIAQAAISAKTLATIEGRLFAQVEAVTLQSNVFTAPSCATEDGDGETDGGEGVIAGETTPVPTEAGPTGPVLPVPEDEGDGEGEGEGDGDGGTGNGAPGTGTPSLAATGVDSTPILVAGSILLGIGAVLFTTRRRRTV